MNKRLYGDRCLHMEMNSIEMMLLQLIGTKKFYSQLQVLCNFGYIKEQVGWVSLCTNSTHALFCIQKGNLGGFWCCRIKCLGALWPLLFSETLGELASLCSNMSVIASAFLCLFLLCVRDQLLRIWWVHVFCPGNEQFW